jgi:hypothetical protein
MDPVYFDSEKDGNVFFWIIQTADKVREERRKEREHIKQEVAKGNYKYDYKRNKFV